MMGLGGGGPFFSLDEISGIGRQADVHDKKIEFTGNGAHRTPQNTYWDLGPEDFLLGSLSIYLYLFMRSKPTELISLRNPPSAYSFMIPTAPVYDTHTFETYMSAVILHQLLLDYSTYTTNVHVGGNLPSAIALLFQLSAPAYITDLRVSASLHELLLYDSNCSYVHIRLTCLQRSSTELLLDFYSNCP